jgi:uncharacterized protein YecA (UPF0149 family)
MAKVFIDEEQQKDIIEQYNAEAAFRSEAYCDLIQKDNHLVQAFRYIVRNYDISIEKQVKAGKQGEGYHICVKKRKLARNDL